MMMPDGTWVCPVCGAEGSGHACWHGGDPYSPAHGCSTWYAGRLLHLSREEAAELKEIRARSSHAVSGHLVRLGFVEEVVPGNDVVLTAEGENLCRHLWGYENA